MPQLQNIVIADGAATPVSHTFTPVTTDGQLASLKERVGLPLAYPGLSASVRQPVKGNGVYRLKFQLSLPQTQTVNGVVSVAHTPTATVELLFSDQSSEQNRKDIRVLVANLLGNATVIQMVEKLEPLY